MGQVITIKCKCGKILFKYFKDKKGKLIKCFLNEIRKDFIGEVANLPHESKPTCPSCNRKLGIITIVRGRPALKVNQSTISIRT